MAKWRPDLDSLRLFVAVCEEGSIARAAERESIVASAISKRISEIEHSTGVTLLVRGGRRVRPTAAGLTLLHYAREILKDVDKLRAELAEHVEGTRGHVRVLANASSLAQFLPRDIASFLTTHPGVRVDCEERVSSEILDGVREGTADLGVCLPALEPGDDKGQVELRPYATDRLMLITHAEHPLARRESVAFVETLDNAFVGLQRGSRMSIVLAGIAARHGRTLDHRMYVGTFDAACNIIAEKLAVGVLAHGAVQVYEQALNLRAVPLTDSWARREVVVCMRDYGALSGPARALVDHLQACGERRRTDATAQ